MARIDDLADAVAAYALVMVARAWAQNRPDEAGAVVAESRIVHLIAAGVVPSWLGEPGASTGRFARRMLGCLAAAPDEEVRAWTHRAIQEAASSAGSAVGSWTGELVRATLIGALLAARVQTIAPDQFYEEVPERLAEAMRAGAAAGLAQGAPSDYCDVCEAETDSADVLGSEPASSTDEDLSWPDDGIPDSAPEPMEEAAPPPTERVEPAGEGEAFPGDAAARPGGDAAAHYAPPRRARVRSAWRAPTRRPTPPESTMPRGSTRGQERAREVSTGFSRQEQRWETLDRRKPLMPRESYYFWLKVGRPEEGSIEVKPEPIPFEKLPREAILTVVLFSFPQGIQVPPEARVGELRLNRDGSVCTLRQPGRRRGVDLDGDREGAWLFFPIRAPAHSGVFQLRCNIYYEQVLVQSRLVTVCVGRRFWRRSSKQRALGSEVDFTIAHSLRSRQLPAMARHDLSLMLNDNGDGTHSLRFFGRGDRQLFAEDCTLSEPQLNTYIRKLRGALEDASWGAAGESPAAHAYRYGGPPLSRKKALERMESDLVLLAREGYDFYDAIRNVLTGGPDAAHQLAGLMINPGRVQIALKESPSHVVPAAMLYDRPLDTARRGLSEYSLCSQFESDFMDGTSLEDCACFMGSCPTPREANSSVVCPSGFWGFRHELGMSPTIGQAPDLPSEIVYHEALRFSVCVSTDETLVLREKHLSALKELKPNPSWGYADTRAEVLDVLGKPGPHIIYFYCHGGTDRGTPFLEVGPPGGRIKRSNIAQTAGSERIWESTRPFVFINGCHTTALMPEKVMDFVSKFIQDGGASGVMGTEISVYERLASEFAEEFFARLLRGDGVGLAVRGTRLALLQRGNPLGLIYIPFAMATLSLKHRSS